ncbi:MAG: hypothetical protein ACE3JK_14210 [Sporolactobacillus sp.]
MARGAPARQLLARANRNKDFTHLATLNGRGITPGGLLSFYALPDYHAVSWKITPQKGDRIKKGPAPGEVWVPGVFADQKRIQIGDKITLKGGSGRTFTVSAIINDATNPSSMFGIYSFYVSEPTLSLLKGGESLVLLAINSKKDYSSAETWLRNQPFSITRTLTTSFNISQLYHTHADHRQHRHAFRSPDIRGVACDYPLPDQKQSYKRVPLDRNL